MNCLYGGGICWPDFVMIQLDLHYIKWFYNIRMSVELLVESQYFVALASNDFGFVIPL